MSTPPAIAPDRLPGLLAAMPSMSTLESGEQALAFLRELAA